MASLGDLPPEVFGSVVGYMADGRCEGTLAALTATCRGFYNITMPHLYQHDIAKRHPALLYWAAFFGCTGTAKRLVDAGAPVDMHMQWTSCQNVFNTVCNSKTPSEAYRYFREHLAKNHIVFAWKIKARRTVWYPIHLAAMSGSLEIVELLVSKWPEAMTARAYKLCPCWAENPLGPGKFIFRQDYCSPMHVAACHHQRHVVRWLLEQGCAPVATTKSSASGHASKHPEPATTALHDAARFGHEDNVGLILGSYQTDVNELDGRQLSPIWYASLHRQLAVVDLLVAHGADIDVDVGDGHTPLVEACFRRSFSAACHLIDRGANVKVEFHATSPRVSEDPEFRDFTTRGVRPIDICCWVQRDPPLDTPLPFSADEVSQTWQPSRGDEGNEWRYYEEEIRDQRLAVVSRLLAAGADLEPPPGGNPPALVTAAANHLSGVVREMIKYGADVNVADRDGVTPLAAAFAYLDSNCPFHAQTDDSVTDQKPFVAFGKTRRECTIDHVDPDQAGCPELKATVELLLENGARVDQADANGNTPLRRLFAAPCFRPYLGLRAVQNLWITPVDRSRIGPLLLQRGADPKGGMTTPVNQWVEKSKQVTDDEWSAYRWPRTPMEHAFWDADYEACKRLLEAGVVPDQGTVLWMVRIVLENGRRRHEGGTPIALEFLDSLPTKWRDMGGGSASCLTIALRRKWLDLAQDLWAMGPELGEFSEKLRVGRWRPLAPAAPHRDIKIAVHCIQAATNLGATSILNGLLELGVRPIPSCALLLAVHHNKNDILRMLVKHGGPMHIKDHQTDGGVVGYHGYSAWENLEGCVNPLRLAIKQGKNDAIRIMLSESQTPIAPSFRHYYLREAYTFLNPSAVACLLEHPSMHMAQADVRHDADNSDYQSDAVDPPLARLVEYVEVICSTALLDYRNVESGPRTTKEKVGKWIECLAAFAQAGVDPTIRNRRGESALLYLGRHLVYKGPERLLRYVGSELRAVAGVERGNVEIEDVEIMGDEEREDEEGEDEEREDGEKKDERADQKVDLVAAMACYEALKSLKIGS